MIIGLGNDMVDIRRVALTMKRQGKRFRVRVFTPAEAALADSRKGAKRIATFATRFAAKEAAAKALGLGISKGIQWRDIEILNTPEGKPVLTLQGAALRRLQTLTPEGMRARLHLSLSDEYPYAWAMVVIETGVPIEAL